MQNLNAHVSGGSNVEQAEHPKPVARSKERLLAKLARGNTTDRLYAAAARYVAEQGGSVVLIAGIQVMQMPTDRDGQFGLVVRCLGKKPNFAQTPKRRGAKS